jgi:hypothetical protein
MKELTRNEYPDGNEKPGYGIWLILLFINIAWGSFSVSKAIITYFDSIDSITLSYYLIMIVIGIGATVCFLMRKRYTPTLIIAFLSINLLYFIIGNFFIWQYDRGVDYFGLIRIIVLCLLAIPYLLISKRVKEVFTN